MRPLLMLALLSACGEVKVPTPDDTDTDVVDTPDTDVVDTDIVDTPDTDVDTVDTPDTVDTDVDTVDSVDTDVDTVDTPTEPDQDNDGAPDATDCAPTNPAISPLAAEVCDAAGVDEDCDGAANDADASVDPATQPAWHVDDDDDGYGVNAAIYACAAPAGAVAQAGDCDDAHAAVSPAAAELCDAGDEDCDGLSGDADPSVTGQPAWHPDADGDGFGGPTTVAACAAPANHVADATDCDDAHRAVSPAATEVCDPADVDEDCDGRADDLDASVTLTRPWWPDGDNDSFGAGAPRSACDAPAGYTDNEDDCDDLRASVFPGATEVCDAVDRDEDCDGLSDDNDPTLDPTSRTIWHADGDGDGFGGDVLRAACAPPQGYVADASDCDDTQLAISPLATERCDAASTDEDCDGAADDADTSATGKTTFYADVDGDGFGALATPVQACHATAGRSASSADCDDGAPAISPDATEVCDAGDVDEDCDGLADDADAAEIGRVLVYDDADHDAFGAGPGLLACDAGPGATFIGGDCDDERADVSPTSVELCDVSNIDEDCDTLADDDDLGPVLTTVWWADLDGDLWGDANTPIEACDEASGRTATPGDCDDHAATTSPAAVEVCDAANTDEDCDGLADDLDPLPGDLGTYFIDADLDGAGGSAAMAACDLAPGRVTTSDDCDDDDNTVLPGAVELCDGRDEDCDGAPDDGLQRYYADADHDGFGTDAGDGTCTFAADLLTTRGDCDDAVGTKFPGAPEMCNTADDDCDGLVDSDDADVQGLPWYADGDGDGVGAGSPFLACAQPADSSDRDDDCDDADPDVSPLATERYGDGTDDNCDGVVDPPAPPPCVGLRVPGDYASLTALISAQNGNLRNTTICLGEGSFVGFADSANNVTIQGMGRDLTTLQFGLSGFRYISGAVTLKHLRHNGGLRAVGGSGTSLVLEDVHAVATNAITLYQLEAGGSVIVRRSEVDLTAAGTNYGVVVGCGNYTPAVLTVENSWIHNSAGNALVAECSNNYIGYPQSSVSIRHTLLSDVATALWAWSFNGTYAVDIRGTIFRTISGTAIKGYSSTTTTTSDSVFDGVATPYERNNLGPITEARVFTGASNLDDSWSPPRPTGAPLVNAGPAGMATDYWNEPRVGVPDIGPVEW